MKEKVLKLRVLLIVLNYQISIIIFIINAFIWKVISPPNSECFDNSVYQNMFGLKNLALQFEQSVDSRTKCK